MRLVSNFLLNLKIGFTGQTKTNSALIRFEFEHLLNTIADDVTAKHRMLYLFYFTRTNVFDK